MAASGGEKAIYSMDTDGRSRGGIRLVPWLVAPSAVSIQFTTFLGGTDKKFPGTAAFFFLELWRTREEDAVAPTTQHPRAATTSRAISRSRRRRENAEKNLCREANSSFSSSSSCGVVARTHHARLSIRARDVAFAVNKTKKMKLTLHIDTVPFSSCILPRRIRTSRLLHIRVIKSLSQFQ
jgi:hypothetical protein